MGDSQGIAADVRPATRRALPRTWLRALGLLAAFMALGSFALTRETLSLVEATVSFESTSLLGATSAEREAFWRELLATEAIILSSRSVCHAAIAALRVDKSEALLSQATADEVCSKVDIERLSSTRVLRIRLRHHDGAWAEQFVTALAEAYVRERAKEHSPSRAADAARQEIVLNAGMDDEEEALLAFARERGLLAYDSKAAVMFLAPLKEELQRQRVKLIELQAEIKQVEEDIRTKRFHAVGLASDNEIQALVKQIARVERERALAMAQGEEGDAPSEHVLAVLASELDARAREKLASMRTELELLRDKEARLLATIKFEEEDIARKEHDLIEFRRRKRELALRDAVHAAQRQNATTIPAPSWVVRVLDRGRVVARAPSTTSWALASALMLVGLAASCLYLLRSCRRSAAA